MIDFDPILPLIGGLLVGLAASLLLLTHGRVLGVSGLVGGDARGQHAAKEREARSESCASLPGRSRRTG